MQRKSITDVLAASLLALTVAGGLNAAPQALTAGQSSEHKSVGAPPRSEVLWHQFSIADLTESSDVHKRLEALGRAEVEETEALLTIFLNHRERAQATANSLLQTILQNAAPAFDDRNQIRLDGISGLLVSATAEHRAWVASFLELQRRATGFVRMEAALYSVPLGIPAKLGLLETRQTLDPAPYKVLKAKLAAVPGVKLIRRPSFVVKPLHLGTIETIEQTTYVKDYELVVVQPGSRKLARPIIDTLHEGTRCKVRAVPLGDQRYSVAVDFKHSRLMGMRNLESTLGGTQEDPLTFSLPEVAIVQLQAWPTLKLGQGFVLRVPDEETGDEDLMILQLLAPE